MSVPDIVLIHFLTSKTNYSVVLLRISRGIIRTFNQCGWQVDQKQMTYRKDKCHPSFGFYEETCLLICYDQYKWIRKTCFPDQWWWMVSVGPIAFGLVLTLQKMTSLASGSISCSEVSSLSQNISSQMILQHWELIWLVWSNSTSLIVSRIIVSNLEKFTCFTNKYSCFKWMSWEKLLYIIIIK